MNPTAHVDLFCVFDEGYAMPAGVMLWSAARELARGVSATAHVVDAGLAPSTRRLVASCGGDRIEVRFAAFDRRWLDGLPDHRLPHAPHLNWTVYLSLLADRVLPDDVGRYVKLDADMLVRASLDELSASDLDGCAVAAVRDVGIPAVGLPDGVPPWRELGLDGRSPYLNGGLLVVDRERWRSLGVEEAGLRYLRERGERIRFLEQEALNAVLAGRWRPLHPRWNHQTAIDDLVRRDEAMVLAFEDAALLEEAGRDPAIVHYATPTKPWHESTSMPWRDAWWDAASSSPFAPVAPRPAPRRRSVRDEVLFRARTAARVVLKGY